MKLYHYTTFDKFKKIWGSNELRFANSHVKTNNDYFERRKSFSVNENCIDLFVEDMLSPKKMNILNYFNIVGRYKQISFTMDYIEDEDFPILGCLSPMMWGHYGDCGNGVCIELDSDLLLSGNKDIISKKVSYVSLLSDINITQQGISSYKELDKFVKSNLDIIFFKKHKHWKFENEFRVLSPTLHHLNVHNATTRIYVLNYNSATSEDVKSIVGDISKLSFIRSESNNGKKELKAYPFPR